MDDLYVRVRDVPHHGRLHEEAIRAVYEAVLKSGDVAVDGGAHVGKHTIPLAHAVGPTGQVFAFEPSPEPFSRLVDALAQAGLNNVLAAQTALSERSAEGVEFLVFADRPGVSGFARRTDAAGSLPAEQIEVKTVSLDAALENVGGVRFMKLDVEGAELQALRGATSIVERSLPVIHIEASFISWDAFGYGPDELLSFCAPYGYRVVDIIGSELPVAASIAASFNTAGVWDYLLLPPGGDGDRAHATLRRHAQANYGISG